MRKHLPSTQFQLSFNLHVFAGRATKHGRASASGGTSLVPAVEPANPAESFGPFAVLGLHAGAFGCMQQVPMGIQPAPRVHADARGRQGTKRMV
jgi:hypothetical protein